MIKSALAHIAFAALALTCSIARSVTISDFEAPTYTAGAAIEGVDGWSNFQSIGVGLVSTSPPLSGSQSFDLTHSIFGRGWGSAVAEVGNGSTLSVLVRAQNADNSSGFYLSSDVIAGSSPAGIELDAVSDTFTLYGAGGSTTTGVGYSPQTTYLLEMVLAFTGDTFAAYYTDITNSGPRTSLFSTAFFFGTNITEIKANGGVFLGYYNSDVATWYDDLAITAAAGLNGDLDGDNDVDSFDYAILKANWLQSVTFASDGDLDSDGRVDITDFALFKGYYQAANPGGGAGNLTVPVPEPGTLALMAVALPALLVLRRCKNQEN